VVVDVTVDVEVDVVEGLDLFDEPHAATDKAVAPVTARMANRVRRGVLELTGIKLSPIVVGPRKDVPAQAVFDLCKFRL
jgi:hypothetical protein